MTASFLPLVQRNARYARQVVQSADSPLSPHQQALALQALEIALSYPAAWPQARDLLLTLAPHLERLGLWRIGIHFLQQGIEQSQEQQDVAGEMRLRYHLGLLLQRAGRYDEARQQHEQSAQLAQQQADMLHLQRTWHRLAYCLRNLRQWDEAESLLARAQNLSLPTLADEQGYACLVRGAMALDRRQWQRAREQFQCCLESWQNSGDPYLTAKALTNLGLAEQRLSLDADAESHYRSALALLRSEVAPHALGVVQLHLGGLLGEINQVDEAIEHLQQAETHFRHLQDVYWQAMTLTNLARAYYHLKQWSLARDAAEQSIQLFTRTGHLFQRLNAQIVLAALLVQLEEWQRAQELVDASLDALSAVHSASHQQFIRDSFYLVQGMLDARKPSAP